VESFVDFIKNASLLTFLNLLFIGIFLLAGVISFIVARRRKATLRFLAISFGPVVSGILTMYFKNRLLDTGKGMFAPLSPEAIAIGRRDALYDAGVGVIGTAIMLLLVAGRVGLNRRTWVERR